MLTAEVREGLEGTYGSLAAFSGRAHAELREVVCPFKTTFGKQKRGMRNERVVSYWAQWQAEEILQVIEKPRRLIEKEHLLVVFHAFRQACWAEMSRPEHWHSSEGAGMPERVRRFFSEPIRAYPDHMLAIRPSENLFWIQKEHLQLPPASSSQPSSPSSSTSVEPSRRLVATDPTEEERVEEYFTAHPQQDPLVIEESILAVKPCDQPEISLTDSSGLLTADRLLSAEELAPAGESPVVPRVAAAQASGPSVAYTLFQAQGLKLTAWGDIHGSVHSLVRTVSDFVTEGTWLFFDPHRYFLFLGDYMDRGAFSLETLYVLMRLKIANPSRVFILRGDHEMHSMNMTNHFLKEMVAKYPGEGRKLVEEIGALYNYLPVAVWLSFADQLDTISISSSDLKEQLQEAAEGGKEGAEANAARQQGGEEDQEAEQQVQQQQNQEPQPRVPSNALQFCHGGMEMGIEPAEFLTQGPEKRFYMLQAMNRRPCAGMFTFRRPSDRQGLIETDLAYNGFMWSDFCLNPAVDVISFNPGRGYVYSKSATEMLLKRYGEPSRYRIRAVFRGHQHSIDQGILFHLINQEGVLGIWEDKNNASYTPPPRSDDQWDELPHCIPFDLGRNGNLVYTLLSAPSASLLFAVDSYINLTIPTSRFETWSMAQIARQIKPSPHSP